MNNKIILAIIGVAILFGALYSVYTFTNKPQQVNFPEATKISAKDHTQWAKGGKNVLVEYSDYQCPACKMFHQILKEQIATDPKITQNITFVYRHFPLDNIHQHARAAAYAAEAAALQGKFFPMSDLLFNEQDIWSKVDQPENKFIEYAKQLKLDEEKFKTDMKSDTVKQKVQADFVSGNTFQVDATPTFYLNGQKVVGVSSIEEFKKLLETTAQNR